jgi:hypothetical protein
MPLKLTVELIMSQSALIFIIGFSFVARRTRESVSRILFNARTPSCLVREGPMTTVACMFAYVTRPAAKYVG